MEKPDLFKPGDRRSMASSHDDNAFVHEALRATQDESLYEPLLTELV